MTILFNILLFLIVLFLYIHIIQQLKKSEDLEIYEMDFSTNAQLQEVCDIKQPVLFECQSVCPEFFETINLDKISTRGSKYDLKIKESSDYWETDTSVDYVVLPFHSAHNLISSDVHANYFTENNNDYIEDADFVNAFESNDSNLKPAMTLQTKYDICMGSKNVYTPLRYHTNYRHFVCVNSGKIHIKMTPWKSSKYLYPIKDFDNYEFKSPVNVWKPQRKYMHEMDKIKFLEFDVRTGYTLYIPPYWWYSIKYSDEPDTIITCFTYNSIMNCVANLPNWGLYFLQQHNIKNHVTKTLKVDQTHTNEDDTNDTNDNPIEK